MIVVPDYAYGFIILGVILFVLGLVLRVMKKPLSGALTLIGALILVVQLLDIAVQSAGGASALAGPQGNFLLNIVAVIIIIAGLLIGYFAVK
ncbi:MAG: hypothetical protein H5T50_03650, partial [Nitrososphaeria archaeon]|nr:hypothetical protein [Nitrososphaeria archaeon]